MKIYFRNIPVSFSLQRLSVLLAIVFFLSSCYQQRRMVNGKNNLKPEDWSGVYEGTLPCEGCQGIETRIVFNNDGSYQRTSRDLGTDKPTYRVSGKSWWDQKQGLIILQPEGSSLTIPYRKNAKGLIMMHLGTGARPREERAEYTLFKRTEKDPTEHYWSLVELNGKAVSEKLEGGRPHILFHGSTGKTDGSGGCNNFFGTFELRPNQQLVVSPLGATRKACMGQNVESEFLRTIEGTSTYAVANDVMTLTRDGKTIARFEAVWLR